MLRTMLCGIKIRRKKSKRQHQELSSKSSRSPSPETPGTASPVSPLNDDSFRPLLRTPPPARFEPPPSPPVPTQPIAPVAPEPPAPLPLMPCQVCGRTFVPQSLAKHVKICEKMTIKKRKTFDSSRQRREGTDLEQYLPKNFGLPENSPFLEKSPPPIVKPTPKPKPQSVRGAITKVSKPTAELQRCPHCNRAFGVRAFERHVEWCADKAKILPAAPAQAPQHITDAKQRLNARTQYKAPLVRTRRSSQTRDKSSNSRSASVDSSRGVSPPPRPREYGDYKHGRVRASESASSNDGPEESSHHVPVIRNSRHTQNSSSGDANVKARQARLARDLSNTRNNQDPGPSSLQESVTDPNIKKNVTQNKPRNRLNMKKQQQLKKLEQIATKYNEKIQDKNNYEKESLKKTVRDSSIPLPKRLNMKRVNTSLNSNIQTKMENFYDNHSPNRNNIAYKSKKFKATSEISVNNKTNLKVKENIMKKKINKQSINAKEVKENSMSIDSLDECALVSTCSGNNQGYQSVAINTELLCVPCIIHDNLEQKKENNTSVKNINKDNTPVGTKTSVSSNNYISEPKLELLYKNPTLNSNRKFSPNNHNKKLYIKEQFSNSNYVCCSYTPTSDNFTSGVVISAASKDNNHFAISEIKLNVNDIERNTHMTVNSDITHKLDNMVATSEAKSEDVRISFKDNIGDDAEQANEEIDSLSAEERFDENYEHDISNDDIEAKCNDDNVSRTNEIECRHGSGETYTKFTEDPADLQEFLNITDKLLTNDQLEAQYSNIDQDIDYLHTPKTSSMETINNQDLNTLELPKHHFSEGFEELKSDLKELLRNKINTREIDNTNEFETKKVNEHSNASSCREVDDLEHISVYKLKFYEEKRKENISAREMQSQVKLPSIMETKTPGRRLESVKKMQNMYKSNRKFKMLGEQTRSNKDYQTFIVQQNSDHSDNQSVSDAPPLKLPRIEKRRLDHTLLALYP